MREWQLPCVDADATALPVHIVRPAGMDALLMALAPSQAAFARDAGFAGRALELLLLPGADGVAGAVFGIGEDRSPLIFGDLPYRLPESRVWRLNADAVSEEAAVLGYCLGAYRYRAFKAPRREPALIVAGAGTVRARALAAAIYMTRDLINTPANILGPAELADAAIMLANRYNAAPHHIAGDAVAREYPAVAAVGAGAARPPVVAGFSWRGSGATESSPLLALCGKGVVFDTGGNDIKPSEGMLRMKKDMGGAATVLGIARVLMEYDLPIRLLVRIGCVENSVSGSAMRPLDVIRTRRGLTVEIGNTDAEGRLVLADLLAEASDARPDLLLDCATLTGAARVAVGPDIVPMFTNAEDWAAWLGDAGNMTHDPLWRLPLWDAYDGWLDSPIADLNNIGSKPSAGAVIAALFLRRFVAPMTPWVHLDLYAWNDTTRPGRPEGGEAQAIRAICAAIEAKLRAAIPDYNTTVT